MSCSICDNLRKSIVSAERRQDDDARASAMENYMRHLQNRHGIQTAGQLVTRLDHGQIVRVAK
jgi:hypothetical protein